MGVMPGRRSKGRLAPHDLPEGLDFVVAEQIGRANGCAEQTPDGCAR
jgi:hypothetical protein